MFKVIESSSAVPGWRKDLILEEEVKIPIVCNTFPKIFMVDFPGTSPSLHPKAEYEPDICRKRGWCSRQHQWGRPQRGSDHTLWQRKEVKRENKELKRENKELKRKKQGAERKRKETEELHPTRREAQFWAEKTQLGHHHAVMAPSPGAMQVTGGAAITENLDRPNMPVTPINLASSPIHILKIWPPQVRQPVRERLVERSSRPSKRGGDREERTNYHK